MHKNPHILKTKPEVLPGRENAKFPITNRVSTIIVFQCIDCFFCIQ